MLNLAISIIAFSFVYLLIIRANSPFYGKHTVFKSKWFHHYRYSIRVSEYNNLIVTLWHREFWGRYRTDSTKIVYIDDTGKMYREAHKWGQNQINKKTASIVTRQKLVLFGKENSKVLNKTFDVINKLEIK